MQVSCKELRHRAWERLRGNYWTSLGVSVLGSLIAGVFAIITGGPMMYGMASYYVDQQRGKKPEFTQMFDGFERFGDTFIGYLLRTLFIFLWGLIPFVGAIIVLVKNFSYSMTFYVMRDFGLGGNDAITKSRELMNGYKWKLFKLNLSFIGWIILCFITFGFGTLFLMPYIDATTAEFYDELLKCNNIQLGGETVAE